MRTTRTLAGVTAGLLLAACSDTTPTGPRSPTPSGPRFSGGVSGAAFTSVNETADGAGHCKNGNPNVNCNQYDGKQYVWLNGGPAAAGLESGDYFWVVLQPGGQPTVKDGTAKNLSDDTDPYTNRTFSWVKGTGVTGYGGNHSRDGNKIRVGVAPAVVAGGPDWYADTPNNGGVYILAICSLKGGYEAVTPRDCKYDAFKVFDGEEQTEADAPSVVKDAAGAYDNTYAWTVGKSADKTLVNQSGGSVTFTYTVVAKRDGGTVSGVKVSGTINAFNPNSADIPGVTIADALSDGTTCKIAGQASLTDQTLAPGANEFGYECALPGLPQASLDNTVTITWGAADVGGKALGAGSTDWTVTGITFAGNDVDESVTVTDKWTSDAPVTLGSAPPFDAGSSDTRTFTYQKTVPVVANVCKRYDNTATFTTNDRAATGSAGKSVTVCGPIANGFTLGFWSNNNGRTTLCAGDPAWRNRMNGQPYTPYPQPSNDPSYLRNANASFYKVASTGTCSNAHANFSSWLLAATATNMSNMLSAQLAATSLDVAYKGMAGDALVKHPLTGQPATINGIIGEAVTFLRANGNTTASGTLRNQATAYKNLFDDLNNNRVFAVPSP